MDKKMNNVGTNANDELQYANIFRIGYTEADFKIDFGRLVPGQEQIAQINSITIPSMNIQELIMKLLQSAIQYEDEFKKDIGFKEIPRG